MAVFQSRSLEFFRLGRQVEQAGDFLEARKFYSLALSFDPDNPIYIRAAGDLASRMGKAREAAFLYEEAIECAKIRSGNVSALVTMLRCALRDLHVALDSPSFGQFAGGSRPGNAFISAES